MRALTALLPLVLIGCAPADSDEDGLSDEFEAAIGSNADATDTDGDGFDDLTEHLTFFDAKDPEDFPYEGEYSRFPLPDGPTWDALSAEDGWDEGEFSSSWSHDDQHGQELKLRRFYGNVILVDIAAEWCGPCQQTTETLEEEYQSFKEEGFVAIQILLDGVDPSQEPDLDRWSGQYDLTVPLISDHAQEVSSNYVIPDGGGSFGIPNFSVISRDFTIVKKYTDVSTAWGAVEEALAEEPPTVEWLMPENWEELRTEHDLEAAEVPYGFTIFEAGSGQASTGSGGDDGAGVTPAVGGGPWGGA